MPFHALARGRSGRVMRTSARPRRLLNTWHQSLPTLVLLITSIQVAGLGEPIEGSVASQVLHIIRVALLGGLLAAAGGLALILVHRAITVLPPRIGAGTPNAAAPRRRWQYLLAAAACHPSRTLNFAARSWLSLGYTLRAQWSGV